MHSPGRAKHTRGTNKAVRRGAGGSALRLRLTGLLRQPNLGPVTSAAGAVGKSRVPHLLPRTPALPEHMAQRTAARCREGAQRLRSAPPAQHSGAAMAMPSWPAYAAQSVAVAGHGGRRPATPSRPNSSSNSEPYRSFWSLALPLLKLCRTCLAKRGCANNARTSSTPKQWHAKAVTAPGTHISSRASEACSSAGAEDKASRTTFEAKRCRA